MMKKQTLAIGNGESRLSVDLELVLPNFETVGCNAICRDVNVDHLVCCDYRMVVEAFEHISPNTNLYLKDTHYQVFKKSNKYQNVNLVPQLDLDTSLRHNQIQHWGSGSISVLVAALLPYKRVYLIGHDLYSNTHFVNNVYKNTMNYTSAQSLPVDPGYWIEQISLVFDAFYTKEFVVVNSDTWQMPAQWNKPNVHKMSYNTLKTLCETATDLL